MSTLWQRLVDSFSPLQKLILKACAVVGALCLVILGIDQFIVQPRQAVDSAPFDVSSVEVKVSPPKIDLGLDEPRKRMQAELEVLRLERERQSRLRRERTDAADSKRDDPG